MKIRIDGRRRREMNRIERGKYEYEKMIARYDSECKLTAHYFIDVNTGEPIKEGASIDTYTCWDCKNCKKDNSWREEQNHYIWCSKHIMRDFDREGIDPCSDFDLEEE